jgi:hypothetical protein
MKKDEFSELIEKYANLTTEGLSVEKMKGSTDALICFS